MKAVEFKDQTTLLNPPREHDQSVYTCGKLPVKINQDKVPLFVSFWKITQDELKLLKDGHHIKLTVISFAHPPVSLEIEKCEELP